MISDLYNIHYKDIYNLAYRMTGNSHDAEDIVQETFFLAVRHISQFKGESKPSTWLYAIAKNACLKHLRKRASSSFTDLETIIQTVAASKEVPEFEAIEKTYYIEQVKEGCLLGLLRCLPLYQRIGFILQVLLEIETADVALILGKSDNATRILIHRAKQNIKGFLCRNCSLYDTANPCRCEYLVNFSLKNEWITKFPDLSPTENRYPFDPKPQAIEEDLHEFKKLAHLYRSLPYHSPDSGFVQKMKEAIHSGEYLIFSSKKVK